MSAPVLRHVLTGTLIANIDLPAALDRIELIGRLFCLALTAPHCESGERKGARESDTEHGGGLWVLRLEQQFVGSADAFTVDTPFAAPFANVHARTADYVVILRPPMPARMNETHVMTINVAAIDIHTNMPSRFFASMAHDSP